MRKLGFFTVVAILATSDAQAYGQRCQSGYVMTTPVCGTMYYGQPCQPYSYSIPYSYSVPHSYSIPHSYSVPSKVIPSPLKAPTPSSVYTPSVVSPAVEWVPKEQKIELPPVPKEVILPMPKITKPAPSSNALPR